MKKTLLLAAFAIATLGASAQTPQKHKGHEKMTLEQRAEMRTQKMQKALDLNEQQVEKMRQMNLRDAHEMKTYRQGRMAESRERMRQLHESRKQEMQQILTPAQIEEWRTIQKDRMARDGDHKFMKTDRMEMRNRRDVMPNAVK